MSRRKRKPIQTISIIFSILIFAVPLLAQLVQQSPSADSPPDEPASSALVNRVNIRHSLRLNQSQTYAFERGDVVALTYQGEIGERLTLRVIPDDDIFPRLLVYVGDRDTPATIVDNTQNGVLCGFELQSTAQHQFVFGANGGDTIITLESGNTCDSE